MRNYKIVASDLDGTLLNNKAEISCENLEAIDELCKKGAYFVPATGRTICEVPDELINNESIRYIIYSNGAGIYDKETKQRTLNCIENSVCREVLDTLKLYETHITYRQNGDSFVDAGFQDEKSFDYYNVCESHRVVVRNFATYLEDFENVSYKADNVEVFSAFFHDKQEKSECKKKFEQNKSLRVVEVSEFNLEIVNANAGKGNALCILADIVGVDIEDTISLGDSDNDRTITIASGLGLAVSNAEESLKSVADEVICSNEEHAVKYVVEKYFCR